VDGTGRYNERVSFDDPGVRRCIFCSQQVEASFLYCPHCGKRLRAASKWYYSTAAVVISLATLGPFALPLVWFNPRYTTPTKIVLTVLVLALTILFLYLLVLVYMRLMEQVRQLMATY